MEGGGRRSILGSIEGNDSRGAEDDSFVGEKVVDEGSERSMCYIFAFVVIKHLKLSRKCPGIKRHHYETMNAKEYKVRFLSYSMIGCCSVTRVRRRGSVPVATLLRHLMRSSPSKPRRDRRRDCRRLQAKKPTNDGDVFTSPCSGPNQQNSW